MKVKHLDLLSKKTFLVTMEDYSFKLVSIVDYRKSPFLVGDSIDENSKVTNTTRNRIIIEKELKLNDSTPTRMIHTYLR